MHIFNKRKRHILREQVEKIYNIYFLCQSGSNISHSFEPIKLLNPYLYMYVTRRQISKERESPDFLPGNQAKSS